MSAPKIDPTDLARRVLETEAQAILGLIPQLGEGFTAAVSLLDDCQGRVIVTGMGKSGIIARKVAATLSSTGTAAVYLNPAEAIHGDLGVVQAGDVVVALSNSGETDELVRLLEAIRRIGAKLIAMTGEVESTLGKAADVTLPCRIAEEACPLNLAPTASTTATLAMGDALAMALSERKGFNPEDFADLHPGGGLGKKLKKVGALMRAGDATPKVTTRTPMPSVIEEMSGKGLGMTCVTETDGTLVGIVTDGDLRRHMTQFDNLLTLTAADVMTTHPVTIGKTMLAVEALRLLEERKITSLAVVDDQARVEGVVHLHDLWRTQMI